MRATPPGQAVWLQDRRAVRLPTARRLWSATVIAERKAELGSAMTNYSPP
jgi:hypothetical protein